jgi:transcriptional regulator with XRE-family HTH domain
MEMSTTGEKLAVIRRRRMWTQTRLAKEAGVSPTTISGIENGRISRPHFGTLRKLAGALGVEPEELVSASEPGRERPVSPLSLEWAISSGEEEFERRLEGASIDRLSSLSRALDEEQVRLRRLYGEVRGNEQRRLVKTLIRRVAASSGSVEASISAHPDTPSGSVREAGSPEDERRGG